MGGEEEGREGGRVRRVEGRERGGRKNGREKGGKEGERREGGMDGQRRERERERMECLCYLLYLHVHVHVHVHVPYSGYFSGGKIFVSSEFLASLWKNFCGGGILNHTPALCSTVSWVKISWFASQPRKPRKFYPPKNTCYTVCTCS